MRTIVFFLIGVGLMAWGRSEIHDVIRGLGFPMDPLPFILVLVAASAVALDHMLGAGAPGRAVVPGGGRLATLAIGAAVVGIAVLARMEEDTLGGLFRSLGLTVDPTVTIFVVAALVAVGLDSWLKLRRRGAGA
ncbi:hypothetical protein [Zavarzinia sp.]|uniref:hypothetical protein n=1 Tax=Zavarzinia sp. TaxID=2027920 RepID=UPI00356A796D